MTIPAIRLVISDIDGTILNSQHQLTLGLKQVVAQLQAAGLPFVLTSARSPKAMVAIAAELGLTTPLAAYNGGYIVNPTDSGAFEPLFSQPLDFTEANKVIQLAIHNFPNVAVNIYAATDWFVPARNSWVAQEEVITGMTAEEVVLSEFLAQQPTIHKILFIGEEEEITSLEGAISKLVLMESAKYRSKDNYLEFTNKLISKELALQKLVAHYQIVPENVMAIGDHDNDVSMIAAAGWGVAMGNATEACKEKADWVTADNDHDGAALAIQKILEDLPAND